MTQAVGFNRLWRQIDAVNGWLLQAEARFLYETAMTCETEGFIVEIGCYRGRSTIALALGSLHGDKTMVHTIDPFKRYTSTVTGAIVKPSYEAFRMSILKNSVYDIVRVHKETSEEAVKTWKDKIKILFIDGDHKYENVLKDFELWTPFVADGGYIIIHDTVSMVGPAKVAEEKFKGLDVEKIGEISAIKKKVQSVRDEKKAV